MGRGTISQSLSTFSSRLRRSLVQNFISRALTIPPATQATTKGFKQFRKRHAFRSRRNGFLGGNFLFRISELTQRERIYVHFANYRFSFRKLQIFISQTTDSHFANYRFSCRKLQIFISQTTDSHFANYRFSFRKLQISISQTTDFHFANYRFPFRKL